MSMVCGADCSLTDVGVHGAGEVKGVRDTESAQTEVLAGACEKLCGGQECTKAGVGHQWGWLEDTGGSVGCHRDMTSRNNSGHSLGFDSDMAVEECSAVWGECGSSGEIVRLDQGCMVESETCESSKRPFPKAPDKCTILPKFDGRAGPRSRGNPSGSAPVGFVSVVAPYGLKNLSVASQTEAIPPDKAVGSDWCRFAACDLMDSPWSQDGDCTAQVQVAMNQGHCRSRHRKWVRKISEELLGGGYKLARTRSAQSCRAG